MVVEISMLLELVDKWLFLSVHKRGGMDGPD